MIKNNYSGVLNMIQELTNLYNQLIIFELEISELKFPLDIITSESYLCPGSIRTPF